MARGARHGARHVNLGCGPVSPVRSPEGRVIDAARSPLAWSVETSPGFAGGAQCRVSRYPILVVTGAKTPASVNQSKPLRLSSAML